MAEGVSNMKKNIHPEYMDTKVICGCGNTFTVQSNKSEMYIEVCDQCHPFYAGKDHAAARKDGKIDKFNQKYNLK